MTTVILFIIVFSVIVIAHELGHALMHCGTGYAFHADTANYCRSANEYEANLFALYLLSHSYDIDERLLQAVPRNRELFTYQEAHQLLRSHCCQFCPHTSYGPLWLFQGSSSSWWD